MAKQINKNWALIESVGYTIERVEGADWPKERRIALPLRESVGWQISDAIGDVSASFERWAAPGAGADLRWQALHSVLHAEALGGGKFDMSQRHALKHCSLCADCLGWLCISCATAIVTPELIRECNGEAAWAAARKGSALDRAMAEIIAATPALQAEKERRALAELVPATPTPTRRQAGRL